MAKYGLDKKYHRWVQDPKNKEKLRLAIIKGARTKRKGKKMNRAERIVRRYSKREDKSILLRLSQADLVQLVSKLIRSI